MAHAVGIDIDPDLIAQAKAMPNAPVWNILFASREKTCAN